MSCEQMFDFSSVDFSRVAVVGSPGSGKTTLSVRLESILGRNAVHLDKVLWRAGWVLPSEEERKKIHNEIISQDVWLIDGMWGSLVADRFKRATVVLHLDYPTELCLARATERCKHNDGKQRFDLAEGCVDKMDDEFVQYITTFRENVGEKLYTLEAEHPEVVVFRFSSPDRTDAFVEQLAKYFKK